MKTFEVKASDVIVGDKIASRNICGGLEEMVSVTSIFFQGGIGTSGGGVYVVFDGPDEMVEIAER